MLHFVDKTTPWAVFLVWRSFQTWNLQVWAVGDKATLSVSLWQMEDDNHSSRATSRPMLEQICFQQAMKVRKSEMTIKVSRKLPVWEPGPGSTQGSALICERTCVLRRLFQECHWKWYHRGHPPGSSLTNLFPGKHQSSVIPAIKNNVKRTQISFCRERRGLEDCFQSVPALELTVCGFDMFSCCDASRFIKFTARETAGLVIFPKESPAERQSLSGINASCKLGNHGCTGDPFPNTNHGSMHTFIQISKVLLFFGTPTNTPTFGHSHWQQWTDSIIEFDLQWGRLTYC